MKRYLGIIVIMGLLIISVPSFAKDYYVSSARGKGKKATIENPAKDLGNIISKLKPGDTVHIASGSYMGKGGNGSDVITVPVSIIGGYDDNFKNRDPWSQYRTILSGDNMSKNWVSTPRLMIDLMKYKGKEMPAIVVDGVIIDSAGRNRYKTEKQMIIARKADPKTGHNPTPDTGGLVIRVSKTGNYSPDTKWDITVKNCVVMNNAPTQGALSVSGYAKSDIKIQNNIVINNTGTGIIAGTKYHGKGGDEPTFLIEGNTVLFTWKYDSYVQGFSGETLKVEKGTSSIVKNNVFGFADMFGINNAAKASILLSDNIIIGNVVSDYLEFDTKINLEDLEDEAEFLHEDSGNNSVEKISIPVSKEWAQAYGDRILIDRNAVEADVKVQMTRANQIRSILGLPLQAGTVKTEESPVWLHRMSIDHAVKTGMNKYQGKYGSEKP